MTTVTIRPEAQKSEESARKPMRRQFVNFVAFKVENAWRRLSDNQRQKDKAEFAKVIENFQNSKRCMVITYTTMGLRGDCDILLWVISYEVEVISELATALSNTNLGKYMQRAHNFLSMTKRSTYIDRLNPEHPEDRAHIKPGKYKYIFVYPFLKKREWYLMTQDERQKMMDEHIRIGNQYPSVKLNTTYSFGIDDQEFVVAFETDIPQDFLDLVQELRESQGSLYTLRDTPILTGIACSPLQMLDTLG